MRKLALVILVGCIGAFFTSCVCEFYQIYKVKSLNNLTLNNNSLVYEDNNCRILYNFWMNGGDAGFEFYNKSDKNIYVNLRESFFILNGIAYDYYKNREFANQETITKEMDIICIPPNAAKLVFEYHINDSLYKDCGLYIYPRKKIDTSSFSEELSPFRFSNIISYNIEKEKIKINNTFYVSDITNYPKMKIIKKEEYKMCEDTDVEIIEYNKEKSPDKFYIRY